MTKPAAASQSDNSEQPTIPVSRYYAAITALAAGLLVYGSFVPFQFVPLGLSGAWTQFSAMFKDPWNVTGNRVDWSVNFLITVPIGFCGLGIFLAERQSFSRALVATTIVLAFAGCLSLGVEFGQVWFSGRIPSLKDVLAQVLGTVAGAAFWLLCGRDFTCWLRSFASKRGPSERLEWFLQAYVLGLIAYSMLPLDIVTSPRELIDKYQTGKFELIPFSYQYDSRWRAVYAYATQIVLYVPVGIWSVVAWRRRDQSARSVSDSLLLGVLVIVGIELAQLMIVARYSSATDLLLGSVGVAGGVWGMSRWSPGTSSALSPRRSLTRSPNSAGWIVAAVGYVLLLAAVFWAPFDFTQDKPLIKQRLAVFWSLPFARMQAGSDLAALFSLLRMIVWFIPLGILVGMGIVRTITVANLRWAAFLLGTVAIAAIAFGIELGQVLLPDRFADSTDAMICVFGGGLGLWIAARVFRARA